MEKEIITLIAVYIILPILAAIAGYIAEKEIKKAQKRKQHERIQG